MVLCTRTNYVCTYAAPKIWWMTEATCESWFTRSRMQSFQKTDKIDQITIKNDYNYVMMTISMCLLCLILDFSFSVLLFCLRVNRFFLRAENVNRKRIACIDGNWNWNSVEKCPPICMDSEKKRENCYFYLGIKGTRLTHATIDGMSSARRQIDGDSLRVWQTCLRKQQEKWQRQSDTKKCGNEADADNENGNNVML